MLRAGIALILLGYLPGALIFRWPALDRERRAGIEAGERAFWHVMISVAWTLGVAFALAALDQYRFDRLIAANAVLCAAIMAAGRTRLGYHGGAARPTWTVILPIALA